jgi:phage tail tape-measure protein
MKRKSLTEARSTAEDESRELRHARVRAGTAFVVDEGLGMGVGALTGAVAGAMAGMTGAAVGAAVGATAGLIAGAALYAKDARAEDRTRQLDDAIGVTKGSLGLDETQRKSVAEIVSKPPEDEITATNWEEFDRDLGEALPPPVKP